MGVFRSRKKLFVYPLLAAVLAVGGATSYLLANCGPFTDVSNLVCPFVLDIYYLGVTAGTTSTTYSPSNSVTRGQMAVFMGALYNQLKRTESPYRFMTGQGSYPFSTSGRVATTVNTSAPNGFATDGVYDYVANQGNNKIDIFQRGTGYPYIGSYTTATANNRLVCDGFNLWTTDVYGTNLKKINLTTGLVTDSYATLPTGTSDITVGGQFVAVTTNSGVSIQFESGGLPYNIPLAGGGAGVTFDGQYYWVSTFGGQLVAMDYCACSVPYTVTLPAVPGYYLAFDGQNVWVPESDGTIAVVGTRGAQAGKIVDIIQPAGGTNTTEIDGLQFTGQNMLVWEHGPTGGFMVVRDVASHLMVNNTGTYGFSGAGYVYTFGFDGLQSWILGYDGNTLWIE